MISTPSKLAWSVKETADMICISPSSVYELVRIGVLPRVPHTGRVLIPRSAVEAWVNSGVAS